MNYQNNIGAISHGTNTSEPSEYSVDYILNEFKNYLSKTITQQNTLSQNQAYKKLGQGIEKEFISFIGALIQDTENHDDEAYLTIMQNIQIRFKLLLSHTQLQKKSLKSIEKEFSILQNDIKSAFKNYLDYYGNRYIV